MVHQQFIRSATCTVYPRLHNINSTTNANANANASMMSLWAGGARGGRFMATTGSRSACTSTNRATAMRMNRRSTNTNNRYGCSILYRCRSTPSTNINATACRFRSNPAKQKPGNRYNSNKPHTRPTSTPKTPKSVDEGKAVESAVESVEGQVAAAASSEAVMEASPSPHQLMMHALRSAVPMIGMCIM